MPLAPGITIVPATPADHDRIEIFMRRHFFRSEPMNMSVGALNGHHCGAKSRPLETLDEDLSLIAVTVDVDGQEQIVGICLNSEDAADDDFHFAFTTECDRFKKARTCVLHAHKEAGIFKKYPVDKVLSLYNLGVDPAYRRKGIGKALFEHAIAKAKAKGYPLVTVMCTSFFTARIAEALDMDCVYSLRFDEYLDEEGVPVFAPPKPHEVIKVFALAI